MPDTDQLKIIHIITIIEYSYCAECWWIWKLYETVLAFRFWFSLKSLLLLSTAKKKSNILLWKSQISCYELYGITNPVLELEKCKSLQSSNISGWSRRSDLKSVHICNLQYSFLSVGIQLLEEVAERGRKSCCIFSYQIYLTMSNYIMVDCQQKKCLGNVFQEHNKKMQQKKSSSGVFFGPNLSAW